MRLFLKLHWLICISVISTAVVAEEIQLIDAHIHYSHDAWERLPPPLAVEVLRKAGLKRAFVSSSSDEGTQKLYAVAPEYIVPVLRPYRKRGELSSWKYDETVVTMLSELLDRNEYAGIGEFHAFNTDIDLPVVQQVISLAKQHGIFLHAHSDAEAIERIFASDSSAVVLWAHSGFDGPADIAPMLKKYPNLWADLAYRWDHEDEGGTVQPAWRKLFEQYPDRFLLGTDTFTPERWYYVEEQADRSRAWLASLPKPLRENIAWKNAERLLARVGR